MLCVSVPMLLGFDHAFVAEVCPSREFGDDVLRVCFQEVKTGLVCTHEHRAEIPDRVSFAAHRLGGRTCSILQVGQFSAGDIRLDQVRGHLLEATPAPGAPKWRNP